MFKLEYICAPNCGCAVLNHSEVETAIEARKIVRNLLEADKYGYCITVWDTEKKDFVYWKKAGYWNPVDDTLFDYSDDDEYYDEYYDELAFRY